MNRIGNLVLTKDKELFFLLNQTNKNKYIKLIMQLITKLGGKYFNMALIILFFIVRPNTNSQFFQQLFVTLTSSHIIVHFLKRKINRPRPYSTFKNIVVQTNPFEAYSFPSGHTTAVFTSALVLSSTFKQISILFFVLAVLTAFSRIYLGVHYPSDVLMGIIIAFLNYILIIKLFF